MLRYKISMWEERPPEVTVRAWRELKGSGLEMLGEHWHGNILPLHFAPNARFRYKHQARTEKWKARKRRLAARGEVKRGGEADNVASGLLEQTLTQVATIRAYQNKVTLKMTGPRYITMKPRNSNQPNKAAEVTTVLKSESREMDMMLDDHMTVGLERIHEPQRTTF